MIPVLDRGDTQGDRQMPKSTHEHQKEATNTDRKFRPEDEHLYEREKQEFQESEKEKRESSRVPDEKKKE
jgi:hypothetical protein